MKLKKNHKKLWLISAISLILTIILISGCSSKIPDIKLIFVNSVLSKLSFVFQAINVSGSENSNLVFTFLIILIFIFILIKIISFLDKIKNNYLIENFGEYEKEGIIDGSISGIKIGLTIGLISATTFFIESIIIRIITGLIFTSLLEAGIIFLLEDAIVYDYKLTKAKNRETKIQRYLGIILGISLTIGLIIGIISGIKNGLPMGYVVGSLIFLLSILISLILIIAFKIMNLIKGVFNLILYKLKNLLKKLLIAIFKRA